MTRPSNHSKVRTELRSNIQSERSRPQTLVPQVLFFFLSFFPYVRRPTPSVVLEHVLAFTVSDYFKTHSVFIAESGRAPGYTE